VTPLEALLEELEANLYAWDRVSLYEFSWFLRGLDPDLTEDEIAGICQQAYDEFSSRHQLHLEWFDWPPAATTGTPAEPGTPLDFDINTTGTIATPFLALVPDSVDEDHVGAHA
jgi:hypothetical protein